MSEPCTSSDAEQVLPPLRIHHLLACMTVAAVSFTLSKSLTGPRVYVSPSVHTTIVSLLIASLATTVVGYGLVWRRKGHPFPGQPGHGLLIMYCLLLFHLILGGCMYAVFKAVVLGNAEIYWDPIPTLAHWYLKYSWHGWIVVQVIVLVGFAYWLVGPRRWKSFYYFYAAIAAFPLFFVLSIELAWSVFPTQFFLKWQFWLLPGIRLLPHLACFVIVIRDLRERAHYHWSHWCGVACFLMFTLAALASSVWEHVNADDLYSLPPQEAPQNSPIAR